MNKTIKIEEIIIRIKGILITLTVEELKALKVEIDSILCSSNN